MNSQNHAPRRQDFQSEVSPSQAFKKEVDLRDCLGGDFCLVRMAAVSMVITSTNQIHLHTQSLCSFCSEQTAIKQQIALLWRQRLLSELDATGLCTDLLFCNESATS